MNLSKQSEDLISNLEESLFGDFHKTPGEEYFKYIDERINS